MTNECLLKIIFHHESGHNTFMLNFCLVHMQEYHHSLTLSLSLYSSHKHTHTPAEPPRDSSVETLPSTTTLTVMRNRGTFTDVSVTWQVTTPSAALDVTPTDGILNFAAGQTSASFQITALADEVKKKKLYFTFYDTENVMKVGFYALFPFLAH